MKTENKPKIIVIVGPTATGKSDLAVEIAKKNNGEIISADSRQVYKGLDIGSGKITKKEMFDVPHYLLDVANPKRVFTVTQYKKLAEKTIHKIIKSSKTPIVVGGTGFYIQSLVDNITLPEVKPDKKLRAELEKKTPEELFSILKKLDRKRASNIDSKNPRRLIRAIEIAKVLGKVPTKSKVRPYFNPLFIGIKVDQKELAGKIQKRLLARMKKGMLQEVRKLHEEGLSYKRMFDLGLEYRYLSLFLQNKLNKKEMLEKLQKEIEHYAKRQMTWFKKDRRINWFLPEEKTSILNKTKKFLKTK